MNAVPLQGLQSDALRMSTLCEGCPQQPSGQLGASGLERLGIFQGCPALNGTLSMKRVPRYALEGT